MMIRIHLSRLLGERKWTQKELALRTGIRQSTINLWYHELVERVTITQLDKVCEALDCTLDELMEYVPNKHKTTGADLIVDEVRRRKK